MTQVQYQSTADRDKVRRFFIRYQDRLLYGTDLTENPVTAADRAQNPPIVQGEFSREADAFWRSDWAYLATAAVQHVDAIHADVAGLALPRRVIDKIYRGNALRVFGRAVFRAPRPGRHRAIAPDTTPVSAYPRTDARP